jgi:hypothetical protein
MDENHENAGASTEDAAQESQPQSETQADAYEGNSDGWDDALDAYEEADGESGQSEEAPADDTQESESKSHFEQDKPQQQAGDLNLEKLAVPNKYKSKVKEYVAPIIEEHQRKVEAATQELGNFQQGNAVLLNILKDIAQNPVRIADYVTEHGERFGIDPSVISHYANLKNRGTGKQPAPAQAQAPSQAQGIEAVFNKHVDKLITTQNPQEFVGALKTLLSEALSTKESEMTQAFKQMLGGYHEEVVNPNLKTFQEQREKAELQVKRSSWNEARDALKSQYKDFDKYEAAIKERLKKDPRRVMLNQNPQALYEQGITHQTLIDEAYQIVSRQDHIEQAKPKKEWVGGLQPGAKHINTTKVGGSDWDEIKHDYYD